MGAGDGGLQDSRHESRPTGGRGRVHLEGRGYRPSKEHGHAPSRVRSSRDRARRGCSRLQGADGLHAVGDEGQSWRRDGAVAGRADAQVCPRLPAIDRAPRVPPGGRGGRGCDRHDRLRPDDARGSMGVRPARRQEAAPAACRLHRRGFAIAPREAERRHCRAVADLATAAARIPDKAGHSLSRR